MPKTGYSAQDSIGRYQPSYPVIDASPPKIQRVALVEPKSGDLPHARDRLESKQKRLERLLIEQFIKLKFAPPGKEEEMAALLAKYLYLGILVPVDFLFFEMPEKMLKKLLKQMKKSKKLFDKLIHLRPILQHQVQKLVEKILHLTKKVQEGLGAVIKRPQQFVQKQVEKVVHTYTQVVETVKEVIQTVMKPVRFVQKQLQTAVKQLQQAIKRVEQFVSQTVVEPVVRFKEKVEKKVEQFKSQVKERAEAFKEKVIAPVMNLFPRVKLPENPLAKRKISLKVPEKITQFVPQIKAIQDKMSDHLQHTFEKGLSKSEALAEKLVVPVKDAVKDVIDRAEVITAVALHHIQQFAQPYMALVLSTLPPLAVRPIQAIKGLIAVIKQLPKLIEKPFQKVAYALSKIADFAKKGKKRLQAFLATGKKAAKRVRQIFTPQGEIRYFFAFLRFFLRLFILFLRLLFSPLFFLLRRLG